MNVATIASAVPDWPAPSHVRALITERSASQPGDPYNGFNLGNHVGDNPGRVMAHRLSLVQQLRLVGQPRWLTQVHGARVCELDGPGEAPVADGSFTTRPGTEVVCAVLSADCAPVFLSDHKGSFVGLLHAGWRGVIAGVIEQGVAQVPAKPQDIIAWVGPSISQRAFEVGNEVREQFLAADPADQKYFARNGDRYMADLPGLVLARLRRCEIAFAAASDCCTYSDPGRWFSHRRQGRCGRMASLIWLSRAL
ncbi:MAG TPA: peptidoglycan editing factor PgeF [Gammaproteobacteria bacterium]|nr:peptidoglycan editing factor PgeF [Gammaproteobacteria bacterium]